MSSEKYRVSWSAYGSHSGHSEDFLEEGAFLTLGEIREICSKEEVSATLFDEQGNKVGYVTADGDFDLVNYGDEDE